MKKTTFILLVLSIVTAAFQVNADAGVSATGTLQQQRFNQCFSLAEKFTSMVFQLDMEDCYGPGWEKHLLSNLKFQQIFAARHFTNPENELHKIFSLDGKPEIESYLRQQFPELSNREVTSTAQEIASRHGETHSLTRLASLPPDPNGQMSSGAGQ